MSNYYDEGHKFNIWLNKKARQIKKQGSTERDLLIYEAGLIFRIGEKAMNKRIDKMITFEGFEEDPLGLITVNKKEE